MNKESELSIALLIDGENISPRSFPQIREDLAKRGTISIFRIYADWTANVLPKGWKNDVLSEYPFVAIQQFSLGSGKSSSDSALIIDTMDLVYQDIKKIDCIALASSDSDFTMLALNLREKGINVLGYGEEKTPPRLKNACHEFTILSRLESGNAGSKQESKNLDIKKIIERGVRELASWQFETKMANGEKEYQDDFCTLAELSSYVRRIKSDFSLFNDLEVAKFADYFRKNEDKYELQVNGPGAAYVRAKTKE